MNCKSMPNTKNIPRIMCFVMYIVVIALCLAHTIESKDVALDQKDALLSSKNHKEEKSFYHRVKDKIQNALKANEKAERYLKGDSSATVESNSVSRLGFIHAFVASLSVIIVSELGDKTFFIAAIMAMRHSRLVVFVGAILALATMTVLSAVLGYATTVIPRWFTYYVSSALFAVFGIKMLREGWLMKPDEGLEEYEEVQADLRKRDEEYCKSQAALDQDSETGVVRSPKRSIVYQVFSKVFIESFTLTFLAEWGDRSQIATIILAARDDVVGVIIGGTLGHAMCTGLAVLGGRFIAQRISVRTVTLCGGVIFLLFALSALVIGPESNS